MNRRTFLATMSSLAAFEAAPVLAAGGNARRPSTSNRPPRKVIVGTVMQAFWGQYPGLQNRLDQLAGIVDQMAAQAEAKYRRGLDLAVLPETAITGEAEGAITLEHLRTLGRDAMARDPLLFARMRAELQPSDAAILYLTSGATTFV